MAYQTPTTIRQLNVSYQHESQCRSSNEQDVGNKLRQTVHPDGEAAGDDAHEDGAEGEENDEGYGSEDAVDSPLARRTVDVEVCEVAPRGAVVAGGRRAESGPTTAIFAAAPA